MSVVYWTYRRQSQQLSSALSSAGYLNVIVANSVDPDQTSPLEAVWSGSILFAYMQKYFEKFARRCFRRHKQMTFSDVVFLGILKVKVMMMVFYIPFNTI